MGDSLRHMHFDIRGFLFMLAFTIQVSHLLWFFWLFSSRRRVAACSLWLMLFTLKSLALWDSSGTRCGTGQEDGHSGKNKEGKSGNTKTEKKSTQRMWRAGCVAFVLRLRCFPRFVCSYFLGLWSSPSALLIGCAFNFLDIVFFLFVYVRYISRVFSCWLVWFLSSFSVEIVDIEILRRS